MKSSNTPMTSIPAVYVAPTAINGAPCRFWVSSGSAFHTTAMGNSTVTSPSRRNNSNAQLSSLKAKLLDIIEQLDVTDI